MRKKRTILLIIVVHTCLIPFLLQGKDFFKIRDEIIENAWRKISIFYVTPTLTLRDTGYNSNIYSYQEFSEPDWTTDLGLQIKLASFLGNRFILEIDENPSYFFFADNVELRTLNNRLKVSLMTYLGKLNIKYQYKDENIRNRPTTEFGAYVRSLTQDHQLHMDYGNYNNFYLSLYLKFGRTTYRDEDFLGLYDLKSMLDNDMMTAGVQLTKIIFTRTKLLLTFEYFENTFQSRSDRNGNGKKASLGIEFPEISLIQGSLNFGIKTFQASNPLFRNYTKPFGSGKISIRLFKKFKFHLQYLLDNFYSFWQADQGYNERSIEAGLEYYLTRNIKFGYRYRAGRLAYEFLTDGNESRRDDFKYSTVSVGYRLLKNVGIGLEYKTLRADSTLIDFTRSTDFIGGFITHEF